MPLTKKEIRALAMKSQLEYFKNKPMVDPEDRLKYQRVFYAAYLRTAKKL